MPFKRNPETARQAVVWLVTAVVVVIGAAACAFIILGSVDSPTKPMIVWGSLFGGVVVVLGSLAIPRDGQKGKSWLGLWLSARDKTDPTQVYRVTKKQPAVPLGTNEPPTLESVRDAAEQGASVRWVPHGSAPERPHS